MTTPSGDRSPLTHVHADGSAQMVDVGGKPVTSRHARAEATLITRPDVVTAIFDGSLPKGEAVGTARIAGIMAAKQTSALIPLCHPLPLSNVEVRMSAGTDRVVISASTATTASTGVEMEALTAASVAALTLYDMIKAVDREAAITDVRVVEKRGGSSGDWQRETSSQESR